MANPVVGNNVAATPGAVGTPYAFNWSGGTDANGTFGAGLTTNTGPAVGFALSDTSVGCCTASYMITSWAADYTVDANGFNGPVGAYLGIEMGLTDGLPNLLVGDNATVPEPGSLLLLAVAYWKRRRDGLSRW